MRSCTCTLEVRDGKGWRKRQGRAPARCARSPFSHPPPTHTLPTTPRTIVAHPANAEGEEEEVPHPLSYAINADRFGPVGRSSVEIVKAVRGVEYLLYAHDDTHSNLLKTLEALRDEVDRKLKRGAFK